jgi:hypothetical protein
MIDILDDDSEEAGVNLSDLVETQQTVSPVPTGTTRNRAATSAILSGEPDKLVEKYRLLMEEEAGGSEVTRGQVMQSMEKQNKEKTMKHVINILGDHTIPLEQRKRLMSVVKDASFKEEPATILQTQSLEAESKGEDLRGESARISLADSMRGISKEQEERQKMMNSFMADMPDASAVTVGELAATEVMPFGRNIIAANVSQQVSGTGVGKWWKDFLLPGTTKADIQKKLMGIPPAKRSEYTAKLLSDIKDSASILPSENHYAQFQTAARILEEPTHSNTSIWTENVMTLLDAVWVGSEVKALTAGKKIAEGAARFQAEAGRVIPDAEQSVRATDELDDVINRQTAPAALSRDAAINNKKIAQLEEKRAVLLGDAGNLASKGDITQMSKELEALKGKRSIFDKGDVKKLQDEGMKFKQAEKEVNARVEDTNADVNSQIARLEQQIEANRIAAKSTAQIDELDKQINTLKAQSVASPGLKTPLIEAMDRIRLNSVVRRENPVTPFSLVEQTNPAAARALHESILVSETDEVAQALTGVGREQALANNTFPQVATPGGAVLNKVNQDLNTLITNTGATRYTPEELAQGISTVNRDFRSVTGLEVNDAMTTVRVDGDHLLIDAHYAPAGGSFTNPQEAMDQAKFALRSYGLRDDELEVMKRVGMDYVPVSGGEGGGDYIIKVKTRQPLSDDNITSWNPLDVKRNFADRISWLGGEDRGGVANWLMDPGSMLHPSLTGPASIAADQAVTLENMLLIPIKEFRRSVGSLSKARRAAVEDYIKEANLNGIKLDDFDLVARGFNGHEMDALHQWKEIWDNHYYIENFDMVRTLNAQGYTIFENANTRLFGKPIPKNQNISRIYDPSTDTVETLSKTDMDDLYTKGGSYVSLRRPVDINGEVVEHMLVRNTPTEYVRKIRDTDSVLNYRDGYYTVSYQKGSKFVDEITIDGAGKETRKTVAVAGNSQDARTFINSRQGTSGITHEIREDTRGFAKDGDGYWDVNEVSGRIAQRLRGQPLNSASGINQLGAGVYIDNPMESATRAARSLAGRSITRPVLETAKKRFVEQYGDILPTKQGRKEFPLNRSEIEDKVNHTSSRVADARTTYNYIRYIEGGYINSADNVFKAGMNIVANMLEGVPGVGKYLERGAQKVSQVSVTNTAKATVFQAYIAMANPLRQWIVQGHQSTRLWAYNPMGMLNGQVPKRAAEYLKDASGLSKSPMGDFSKFVEESGMVAGVDRNSLVRGLGLAMADSSSRAKRGIGMVTSLPQTVGFDIGEKANQLMHLASVHEKYSRAGKNLLDKTTRDLALTEARSLSYDLNKAGELAYTQSSMAMMLQFLQMPHKAMLQVTNRKIPLSVSLRMQAWDMAMWGIGGGALYSIINGIVTAAGENDEGILPDNPELRDKIVYGLEATALNKMFTMMDDSGEQTRIDFSALQPNDMDGWARMYHAMLDDGMFAMLAASPAGQLMAVDGVGDNKRNGRIPKALITLGRYMNVFEELDTSNPTEFTAVLNDVAKITSGWSAAQNAKMLLETRKKLSAAGTLVNESVTIPEVWAAALGFGTLSDKELYLVSRKVADGKKAHEEDVLKRYRDIVNYYTENLGVGNNDTAHIQKVTSMMMRTFDDPADLDIVRKQWQKDLVDKKTTLTKQVLTAAGIEDSNTFGDNVRMMPINDEQKALILQRHKDLKAVREMNKEGK